MRPSAPDTHPRPPTGPANTPTQALTTPVHTATALLAVVLAVGGCSLPQAPTPKATHDLGPLPTASVAPVLAAPKPLQLLATSAPAALGGQDMRYRLAYAQPLQPRAYALARWSMPPAQLVHQRLRQQLAADGWQVGGGHAADAPVLHIELDVFEQVFDTAERSHGLVQWQASLRQGARTLAQHTMTAQVPATTPDAAGGALALAQATDQALAQLRPWLSQHAPQRP